MSAPLLNTCITYMAFYHVALAFHLDQGLADWTVHFSL